MMNSGGCTNKHSRATGRNRSEGNKPHLSSVSTGEYAYFVATHIECSFVRRECSEVTYACQEKTYTPGNCMSAIKFLETSNAPRTMCPIAALG